MASSSGWAVTNKTDFYSLNWLLLLLITSFSFYYFLDLINRRIKIVMKLDISNPYFKIKSKSSSTIYSIISKSSIMFNN